MKAERLGAGLLLLAAFSLILPGCGTDACVDK